MSAAEVVERDLEPLLFVVPEQGLELQAIVHAFALCDLDHDVALIEPVIRDLRSSEALNEARIGQDVGADVEKEALKPALRQKAGDRRQRHGATNPLEVPGHAEVLGQAEELLDRFEGGSR